MLAKFTILLVIVITLVVAGCTGTASTVQPTVTISPNSTTAHPNNNVPWDVQLKYDFVEFMNQWSFTRSIVDWMGINEPIPLNMTATTVSLSPEMQKILDSYNETKNTSTNSS